MEITKIAEQQIKQNEASESMDFTANNAIIRGLLVTIEQLEQTNRNAKDIARLQEQNSERLRCAMEKIAADSRTCWQCTAKEALAESV